MADLYQQAQDFRDALLAGDRRTASVMVRSYGTAYQAIDREIDRIRLRMMDLRQKGVEKDRFSALLYQEKRVQALQQKTLEQISNFAQRADIVVGGAVGEAVVAGSENAQALIRTAIPEGVAVAPATIDGEPISAFSADEVSLRSGALEQLTGVIQPGQPVRSLFDALGPQASQQVTDALISGLALGKNPRDVARMMRDALGGNLTRALTIARTETLRAYREASRAEYLANEDVIDGWIWVSAASERTCASCWAQHGSEHPLDEVMATHPRCRCSMAPKTKTWEQLGLGRTPESVKIPQGSSLFAKLPVEQQRKILGPSKFTAYRGKKIGLSDLVARRQSPVWGPSTSEASLRQALANAEARKAARPIRKPREKPVQVEDVSGGGYLDRIKQITGARTEWGLSRAQSDALDPDWVRRETGKQPGSELRGQLALNDTKVRQDLIDSQIPQIEEVGEVIEDEIQRRLATVAVPGPSELDALQDAIDQAARRASRRVGPDWTPVDRASALEAWREAKRALEQARDAEAIARRRIVAEIISEIRGESSRAIRIKSTSKVAGLVRNASELLPGGWIELMQQSAAGIKVRKVKRGYFSEGGRTIAISTNSSVGAPAGFSTALHELGHWAEWNVPGLKALQSAWYRKRTIGEEPQKLRDLTGIRYDADEIAREDQFADPYIGKDYATSIYDLPTKSNYEILTMTLEALFATDLNWKRTLERDPGTARFVLGILALL